jgi:GNAT superfamily N-acetyltransferase
MSNEKELGVYSNQEIIATLVAQLETFLDHPTLRNRWIEADDVMSVYLRKAYRRASYPTIASLDIASIEVDPEYQRRGLFRTFVTEAHQRHPYRMTYLESVHTPVLERWCERHGWTLEPSSSPPSYYLLRDAEESRLLASQ